MELRGMMGGFYRISEWIMRFSVTNLLWLICSIPFILLFVGPLITPTEASQIDTLSGLLFLLIPSAVAAPFTLFPATTAMFVVVRKWIMGEEDVPLFKTFFKGFKENYLYSMLGGFVFILIGVIAGVNFRFYGELQSMASLLSYLFIALFVLVVAAFFNFFCLLSHLHMKFWALIKNSFLFSIGKILTSIVVLLTCTAVVLISTKFTFLIPFFSGSLIAYLTFWHFYRALAKIQAKQAALEESETDQTAGADSQ